MIRIGILYVSKVFGYELLQLNGASIAKPNNPYNYGPQSPLWAACAWDKHQCAATLINLGADVNEKDQNNHSILMATIYNCHEKCANILLQNGAKVDLKDNNGRTALFYAVNNYYNKVACAELLLKHKVEIDARDLQLQTPLMYASREGNLEGVKLLLHAGAEVNAQDSNGNALFHAVSNCYRDVFPIIKTLREHHANIDARDNSGLHVVHHALKRFKNRRNDGDSTEEFEKVINYLMSEKPKISFSTRLAVFYHLNRKKIWASAFFASAAGGGLYFCLKKS